MKLLHIDSSILGTDSTSRRMTAAIVAGLCAKTDCDVTYRDLVAEDPPHVTLASLPWDHPISAKAGELNAEAQAVRNESQSTLDEFVEAETVVIGAPMYNFGISTQLKSWFDRIIVPGKTFRTNENGTEGFMGDKRIIVAVSRGWVYKPGTEVFASEHVETYLRAALAFIGISDPEFIVAEGIALGKDGRAKALAAANARIDALAA